MTTGRITVYSGPMYAGKTTKLIQIVHDRVSKHNRTVLFIKHKLDQRFTNEAKVISHDGAHATPTKTIQVVRLSTLAMDVIDAYDVICVDEGQFFPDLVENCDNWANRGRDVHVAGLSSMSNREIWPEMEGMVAKSDDFFKLHSDCALCGKVADWTYKFGNEKCTNVFTKKEVGGKDMYIATCRGCHIKATKGTFTRKDVKPFQIKK